MRTPTVRMIPNILVASLVCAAGSSALAFEQFTEYRIVGAEIASVELREPEPEDPWILAISVVDEGGPIELEADNDAAFMQECRDTIERVTGSQTDYVEIVAWVNADTMNGSFVLQCAQIRR